MPRKPKFPKDVYKDGKLLYTIVNYTWISKSSPVLKPGWLPIKKFNPKHPDIVAIIQESISAQEEIKKRSFRPFGKHLQQVFSR